MWFFDARLLSALLIAPMTGFGQTFPTIPEALARAKTSLTSGATIPSGPPPSLDLVLSDTDLIVRGVVGTPRSYLSDDQRDVLSDYPILNPTVVYQARGLRRALDPAAKTMTVTLHGGVIEIDGLTFTNRPGALPQLDPGNEAVLCLKQSGGKYLLALKYFGAFAIRNDQLAPLTRKNGFAPDVQRMAATQMIATLRSRAEALHALRKPE